MKQEFEMCDFCGKTADVKHIATSKCFICGASLCRNNESNHWERNCKGWDKDLLSKIPEIGYRQKLFQDDICVNCAKKIIAARYYLPTASKDMVSYVDVSELIKQFVENIDKRHRIEMHDEIVNVFKTALEKHEAEIQEKAEIEKIKAETQRIMAEAEEQAIQNVKKKARK